MKIFPVKTIAEIDGYTIEHEPILSVNLMERAAKRLFEDLVSQYPDRPYLVLAGPGNNGGDALAISRMLLLEGFEVSTLLLKSENLSNDASINRERLRHFRQAKVLRYDKGELPSKFSSETVIIDGLFGSGLNRPLEGKALDLVKWVNDGNNKVVSIDIPSGLMGEDNGKNNKEGIVKANYTYTFQFPKLSFFFPENVDFVGDVKILDIGLHQKKIAQTQTQWFYTLKEDSLGFIPPRKKFDHKGTMGHALLIAGSYGKMGAAILASKACMRSGVGLLTVHLPNETCSNIHVAVPEAMVSIDRSGLMFTEHPSLDSFSAVGVGPGIGTRPNCVKALRALLQSIASIPLVLDADALNIVSQNRDMLDMLPENSILTPHPKEFERLAGSWGNDYEKMDKAIEFAQTHKVVVVLKGAYTMVALPDGTCHFNSTGNPGMATAGSGDTLTGIILALLAKGISPYKSAIAGVYLHGLAGDIACEKYGNESLIASDIIASLGEAFKKMID